ncbi:ABC transporter permease [Halalkalibacter sp. APA_J-10(15)]|uniref:ABC transporter permease n=1 Tax=Halalkalibacter sp. APA_J-10(15) TaxID=2933805 RepID=UPI001FF541B8|nr:ABC transporter permease [Halalkalibacter sp. APA_J-10(15)]MCK0471660.1 ABC transporter permease [Halalkalibacter sp. APA_J-10(15)]
MSVAIREFNAMTAITFREFIRAFRSPVPFVVSLVFPILFLGILGGSLAQNLGGGIGFHYLQFVMIGMIVNSLFLETISGMSSLIEERDKNMTQGLYVSPISRYSIILGKMIGSGMMSLIGLAGIIIVAIAMQIPLGGMNLLWLLLITPVIGMVGASLGIFFIGFVRDSKTADAGSMLLVMPQLLLSGALIPITHSEGILGFLAKIMPMTYCIDFARAVFYWGEPEYDAVVLHHPLFNLSVMIVLFLVLSIVGSMMFARAERNR